MNLPDSNELNRIITTALAEDIGAGDVTSRILIPQDAVAELSFVAREPMTCCGSFIPRNVYQELDKKITVELRVLEGAALKPGDTIAIARGNARALLVGERVVLNLMQRMCGVANLTRQYVDKVKGTKAVILDTRKTMPGLRVLDKYAVKIGGGENHRMRLDDMVLIKDNHISLAGSITAAIKKARQETKLPLVVECDTLQQLSEALLAKPDRILLDNMSTAELSEAVALSKGMVMLEASGGVSLETVTAIAKTGVNYISVGKLTHSAVAADIGADIKL